jgi:hypothetical protein
MRYRWEIKTTDTWYSGTDASVFLSLSGLDASMREVQISDPDAINDWERGDVNHGSIETQDLGELQTGTLRHDQSGPAAGWSVDWVKITNEEDGREWTATVGTFDSGGRFPLLRFSRTNDGQFEEIKKQRAQRATYAADKEAAEKIAAKRQAQEQAQQRAASAADADLDSDLAKQQRELDRELKKAEAEAKLAEQRAKLDQMRGGGPTPSGGSGSSTMTFRTYELFGVTNGGKVPLSQVVLCDANTGRCSVVPGGRVMVAEAPSEGFGLAGVPGRWSAIYSGRSPTEFGLDSDKGVLASDGSRGWVVTAAFLSQVFGAGWRAAVYS